MKKMKKIRACDFKRWLKNHSHETFGCGTDDCPLHYWLEREMSLRDLDELPPWCSRFVGYWDARHHESDINLTGRDALKFLEEVTV